MLTADLSEPVIIGAFSVMGSSELVHVTPVEPAPSLSKPRFVGACSGSSSHHSGTLPQGLPVSRAPPSPPPSPSPPTLPPPVVAPEPGDETQARIDRFISEVCKGLPPSVLSTPAPHQRARLRLPATEDGLPHWSARVAAQGRHRVSNPEVQAQNIPMRKWNITSEKRPPDADAIKAYNDFFSSQLGSAQREAVRALFTAIGPQPSVEALDIDS
jgi:hypothetical protein